jgi:hypothetical protein
MIATAPNHIFVNGRLFEASDLKEETIESAECMVLEGDEISHVSNRSDTSVQDETGIGMRRYPRLHRCTHASALLRPFAQEARPCQLQTTRVVATNHVRISTNTQSCLESSVVGGINRTLTV